jgi:prepilin-type N-terminal cleavage/methylation domain-containing protein/prepilin-type processing-associated H-X9-DG protein
MSLPRHKRPSGFTLVELLVVIAIIGLLVSILLPSVQAARESSRRVSCQNNLKQVGLAVINYESAKHTLPVAGITETGTGSLYFDTRAGKMISWVVLVLPFMEEKGLYDQFDLSRNILDQPNEPQAKTISTMLCPSDMARDSFFADHSLTNDKHFAKGNYAAYVSPFHVEYQNYYPGALISGRSQNLKSIVDGISKTILVAELRTRNLKSDQRGAWALPWAGASLLAFDAHSDTGALGYAGGRNFHFSEFSKGLTQPPNGMGPNADTIFICEDPAGAQFDNMPCLQSPSPANWDSAAPRSRHTGGVQVVFLDGHVDFIADGIDDHTMAYLVSIDDGQLIKGY